MGSTRSSRSLAPPPTPLADSGGRRRVRCAALLTTLALLPLTALPLAARDPSVAGAPAADQEPQADPLATPEFHLERIVVAGLETDAARQIVLSESRLVGGRTYSEQQLREAVYRVKRLPFVVVAEMALQRGSERGAYELVITVEAAKPVFYSLEIAGFIRNVSAEERRLGRGERFDVGSTATIGVRKFVGSRGLLFGSAQGYDDGGLDDSTVQVGYTRYGLFRPGGYATVGVSTRIEDFGSESLQTSAELGVPLVGNHALRGSVAFTQLGFSYSDVSGFQQHLDASRGELAWIYDTTDDPLVPTAGTRVTTTVAYSERDQRLRFSSGPGAPDATLRFDSEELLVRSEARRWWSLTPRQSLGFGGVLSYFELSASDGFGRFDGTEQLAGVELLHAVDLWDYAKSHRLGDLRLESGVALDGLRESHRAAGNDFDEDHGSLALRSSLVFRNAWGVLKLSLLYTDKLGGDR